jgi:hypothetical protein
MKKFTRGIILSVLILVLLVIHFATSKHPFGKNTLLYIGLALFNVILWPIVAWVMIKRQNQGEPLADEMSKQVTLKTYAKSYFLSFISWGMVFGISEYLKFNTRTFFIVGTAAMIIIGILSWVYYQIKGVKDE